MILLYLLFKGLDTHIKRIDGSNCFNSEVTSKHPMEWYVGRQSVAGFANTWPKRRDCNARFVTIGSRVFMVSTKPIDQDQEVFAYYKRTELKKKNAKTAKGQPVRRR